MNQIAVPPPLNSGKQKPRRALPFLSEKDETRSVQIAVLATIVVHLLLLSLIPRMFNAGASQAPLHPHAAKSFKVDLVPPPPKPKPVPKQIPRYVEANPNAPENTPDKTNNVSDRNQQVAQEKPNPKGKSDMPALSGRKDIQSNQIVTGSLNKPAPDAPVPPAPTTPTPPQVAVPKRQQIPLAGADKDVGNDVNGFGTNISKVAPTGQPTDQKVDGSPDAPLITSAATTTPRIDPKKPRPRQTLEIHARPAVFTDNQFGTSNAGITALDSRWSNYGVYLHRLTETVQIEWDNVLDESHLNVQSGTIVAITFTLNSKGEIPKISKIVTTPPGTPDAASQACERGLTARAPYGPWTDDMIAILGQEQEMTFTFLYE